MVSSYIASMILGLKGQKAVIKEGLPDLEGVSAAERMEWATLNYPGKILLTTSFGAQSAAFLHLATQMKNDLPCFLSILATISPKHSSLPKD